MSGSVEGEDKICFRRGQCDEFLSIRFPRNKAIVTECVEDGFRSSRTEADSLVRVRVSEGRLEGLVSAFVMS